jgi:hypothetical protein
MTQPTALRHNSLLVLVISLQLLLFYPDRASATTCSIALPSVPGQIRDYWNQLQGPHGTGPDGPLGCPTALPVLIANGNGTDYRATFQKGQIVWSYQQRLVTAAYTDPFAGPSISVSWQVTEIYSYDYFIVRRDIKTVDGKTIIRTDQDDVKNGPRTSGQYTITPDTDQDAESFSIIVEGCDNGFLGSHCRQHWSQQLGIIGSWYVIPALPPAGNATQSKNDFLKREVAILQFNACKYKDLGSSNINTDADDYTTVAMARLELSTQSMNRAMGQNFDGCTFSTNAPDVQPYIGKSMTADQLRQSVLSNITEQVESEPQGTAGRDNAADFAWGGLVPIAFRFATLLQNQLCGKDCQDPFYEACKNPNNNETILQHILFDLGGTGGPLQDADQNVCYPEGGTCLYKGPQSENHLFLIASSRYLFNQLIAANYQANFAVCSNILGADPSQYNNGQNGLHDFLLNLMKQRLQNDFLEYNSRPYQDKTALALHNLFDFANDSDVKTAAQLLLDYISAKVVVSNNNLRRYVPFRRRKDYVDWPSLIDNEADPQTARFYALVGNTSLLQSVTPPLHDHYYNGGAQQTPLLSDYRVPDVILDFFFRDADQSRQFFQRIHHAAVEIYSKEPDFLITAGGIEVGAPYTEDWFTDRFVGDQDHGWAMFTTLMPEGATLHDWHDFILFQGLAGYVPQGNNVLDEHPYHRINTCVAPDFACGYLPYIPQRYLSNCTAVPSGNWTFIDVEGLNCADDPGNGFYLAFYRDQCNCYDSAYHPEHNDQFGFFEAMPIHPTRQMKFSDFVQNVLNNNAGRTFSGGSGNSNKYTSASGRHEVDFSLPWDLDFYPDNDVAKWYWPIQSFKVDGVEQLSGGDIRNWPLATGGVIKSNGGGRVCIDNILFGERLILDQTAVNNPFELEIPFVANAPCD